MQRAGGLNALILSPTGGSYRAFKGSDLAKGASLAVMPWFTRPQERLFPLSSESSWGPLLAPQLEVCWALWFESASNFRLHIYVMSCLHAAPSLRGLGLALMVDQLQCQIAH